MGVQKYYNLLSEVQTADSTVTKKVSDSQTLRTYWKKYSEPFDTKYTYRDRQFLWGQGTRCHPFSEGRQGPQERRCRGLTVPFVNYRATHMPTVKQP